MFAYIIGLLWGAPPGFIMEVEAHQDLEVYVAPTVLINNTDIQYQLDSTSVFGHTINDVSNVKKQTQYGYISMDDEIMVYNPDTVKFSWKDCDYLQKSRECSYENNHWILESYITFDTQQITVRLILFDENMQPIGQSVSTNTRVVKIIKRQKVTRSLVPLQRRSSAQRNCGPTSCSTIPTQGRGFGAISQTTKEDLEPAIVVVEPRLLDKDIQQASVRLWTSIKIN